MKKLKTMHLTVPLAELEARRGEHLVTLYDWHFGRGVDFYLTQQEMDAMPLSELSLRVFYPSATELWRRS